MKTMTRILSVLLAVLLLLTACGKKTDKNDDTKPTDASDFDYNDLIDDVTDRKISDCISVEQINALLVNYNYSVAVSGVSTDSEIAYASEDGKHTIVLLLENMTREDFDLIATNPAFGWIALPNLSEMAYWNSDQTELIVYHNGYGFSMSVQNIANDAMLGIAGIVLDSLNG